MRRIALVLAVGALLPGCLGRAQDLIADSNARVIVTGAGAGDALSVDVAGERRSVVARDEGPLVVYLTLPAGTHAGLVRHDVAPPRCAAFVLLVEDGPLPATTSVDLHGAAPCVDPADAGEPGDGGRFDAGGDDAGHEDGGGDGGFDGGEPEGDAGEDDAGVDEDAGFDAGEPDDAGVDAGPAARVFVALSEGVAIEPCVEPLCLQVTRAEADGTVAWLDLGVAEVSGQVPSADIDALADAVLSPAADALFGGADPACTQPRPVALLPLELERRYLSGESDDVIIEAVDVNGCTGTAAELRARLAFLRQLALGL